MDKINLIQEYISRCNAIIASNNRNEAITFQDEIIGVFGSEIDNIRDRLSNYSGLMYSTPDFVGDIAILKQKLINYMGIISEANLAQKQIVAVTLNQTIGLIDDIPEENLSSIDKEALKELLYSLEGVKATKDKGKLWGKAREILKFTADKGAEAAIAVLPFVLSSLMGETN
jgi:uncharacterized membrane protein